MQNAMLDSTVSSNPQELFDFNAVHNGEHCIASLDPKDRGTERQFRFTRALLCTLLGVKSDNTISNHIEAFIKRGVIEVVKNLTTLKIPTNGGMQETVLYDLTVFNHLVMRLDTDKAWEMKAKFNMTRAGIPRALARGRNASNQIISQKHLTFPKTRL